MKWIIFALALCPFGIANACNQEHCPLDSYEYIQDHLWQCQVCLKMQVNECDCCVFCGEPKITN